VPAPIVANEASQQPEEPVAGAQARALVRRSSEDRELVAQQDVLGDQVAVAPTDRAKEGDEQEHVLTHCRMITAIRRYRARSAYATLRNA
jgi:hypothetical protein